MLNQIVALAKRVANNRHVQDLAFFIGFMGTAITIDLGLAWAIGPEKLVMIIMGIMMIATVALFAHVFECATCDPPPWGSS